MCVKTIHFFCSLEGNEPLDIRLLSILLTSVNNWENLGVKLGIPLHRIEEIKINCSGDLDKCKNKLYDVWLRLNTNPTWNEIVSALEQMEENYLADKIRQRFLQPHNDSKSTVCDVIGLGYSSSMQILKCLLL